MGLHRAIAAPFDRTLELACAWRFASFHSDLHSHCVGGGLAPILALDFQICSRSRRHSSAKTGIGNSVERCRTIVCGDPDPVVPVFVWTGLAFLLQPRRLEVAIFRGRI